MNKMDIYNRLKTPPEDALKKIGGGRLKGFMDISPQWRIERMTEVFGPVGIGWYFQITDTWFEGGPDNNEVTVFVRIDLYYKTEKGWSEAIPGVGGSAFVVNESKGPHMNDDALKMAITDALGFAMKYLGMGADVYRGLFDTKNSGGKSPHKIREDQMKEIEELIKTDLFKEEEKATLYEWLNVDRTEEEGVALLKRLRSIAKKRL